MTSKFQIGDIVWAKMRYYPPWPGIIITPVANIVAPYNKGVSQHFVNFYGAGKNNWSWIPDTDIVKHSPDLIEEAKKSKSGKLKKAIEELEIDIKGGLILEKQKLEMRLEEKEAYKGKTLKKKSKKRKRDQEKIEAKCKKPKVSGETNKEIKETHVVIEDLNVYKNQQEIDKDQVQEKNATETSRIHPNEGEFDEEHKVLAEVTEHKINESQEEGKETKKQCVQEVEIVEEQVLPIKDCVIEKDSTPPEQPIDKTLKQIFSSEFWKNKSDKIQALKHLLKVIGEEIKREESLEKQEFEMQYQEKEANKDSKIHQNRDKKGHKALKQQGEVTEQSEVPENKKMEDNDGKNKMQRVPEIKIIDQRVLSTDGGVTEKDSSTSEQSIYETLEPILFSDGALSSEFWENVILDKEEQTKAFLQAHFKTSSENIIIPIRPKEIDKLQLLTPPKGLNFIHEQLPRSLIKPYEVTVDWSSRKGFWAEFVPSPIKFGFTGNGFLKSRMMKNLLLSKHNVTLWNDTTTENIEAEEAFTHGAKRVKTFEEFMKNCDIIFSYWEDTRTVKLKMLHALCSVSKEVFAKKGYVELSTLDPESAYQIGKAITDHGGRFLEAAVLGDMQDADDGDLVALASGDQGLFEECSSAFQAIAKYSYYYKGKIGRGSIMKIGHSMMQGTALAALAEVVALIQSYGFKEEEFTAVQNLTPFQHRFWMERAKSMFNYKYIASRPVDDQRRDFQLGLDIASSSKRPTCTCSAANEIYKRVIKYSYK